MSRYIDADALCKLARNHVDGTVDCNNIMRFPTVDAVPVVRCSECKHNIGEKVWLDGEMTIDCANGMGYPPPNWFCADGERRTDEQQT